MLWKCAPWGAAESQNDKSQKLAYAATVGYVFKCLCNMCSNKDLFSKVLLLLLINKASKEKSIFMKIERVDMEKWVKRLLGCPHLT